MTACWLRRCQCPFTPDGAYATLPATTPVTSGSVLKVD